MTTYKIFTDGGSRGNPGPSAAGFVLYDDAGILREKCGKLLGTQTNNFAEYSAILLAYQRTQLLFPETKSLMLDFYLDSELAVKQLQGEYQIKNPTIGIFYKKIKTLENLFGRVQYTHIPRSQNKEADKLVNQLLDHQWPSYDK